MSFGDPPASKPPMSALPPTAWETQMMNSAYHFNRMRELFEEFEPSRERSLAITKLEECQMWLAKCKPTVDALKRDLHAPLFDYQADEGTPTQALEKELRAKLFEGFDDPATD